MIITTLTITTGVATAAARLIEWLIAVTREEETKVMMGLREEVGGYEGRERGLGGVWGWEGKGEAKQKSLNYSNTMC